jgi:tetratricopeptide (TPR) repeat protein/tRNA A-37 threonylcarbamoyl transferase component Bud32
VATQIGSRYRVLERLGTGGMGEVFLAEDLRLQRRVALKMLSAERLADPASRSRLMREARVASALSHPNIAVIYEIDEADSDEGRRSFIAMEYVPGRTLAEHVRTHALDAGGIVALVRQVAEALAEAHQHGVIHRDVKPSNVMVTDSGRVKVLDFGLADYRPVVDDEAATRTRGPLDSGGGLVGTIAYMSPEQALGQDLDRRSDIFSLGVVLHELLMGAPPFAGPNAVAVIDAILHQEPPPLVLPSEPRGPELQRIVRRMLTKDRDARYASLREVVRELDAAVRGDAPAPSAPATGARIAVTSFTNVTGDPEDEWLGTGIAETVSADLQCLEGLTVIARDRVVEALRKVAGPEARPDEGLAVPLGRELGARWVVGGGYQRLGDVVRVIARVTEVETGAVVETVKRDGRMDAIFSLQDAIVAELSEGLRLGLARGGRDQEETQVVEAYEAFARGMINLRVESYESLDRAVLLFERAVALDPRYARAHLLLGSAYDNKASYLASPEMHERALQCFRRAAELAPSLALAWKEMGSALVSLGREDEGMEAIQRALAMDPADAASHAAMGRALFVGKADFAAAIPHYETALRLNPQAGWSALQLAHVSALVRDFARGEKAAAQAAALQEEFQSGKDGVVIVGAHMRLGHLAALQGRHEEALESFARERAFFQRVDHGLRDRIRVELGQRVGASQQALGRKAEAAASFEAALATWEERLRLGADDPFTRYYVAAIHALRGEVEQALATLARAVRMRRAFTAARARVEPEFDGLRADHRFRDLVGA